MILVDRHQFSSILINSHQFSSILINSYLEPGQGLGDVTFACGDVPPEQILVDGRGDVMQSVNDFCPHLPLELIFRFIEAGDERAAERDGVIYG